MGGWIGPTTVPNTQLVFHEGQSHLLLNPSLKDVPHNSPLGS